MINTQLNILDTLYTFDNYGKLSVFLLSGISSHRY